MELLVSDLAVARGGVVVLSGISFALHAGEVLVLRGPNGIGKTTVLRSIAGLQPVFAGQINLAADEMAYAGHVDAVKSVMTVGENLQFWASVYGTVGIEMALTAMELIPLRDRPAHSLSAGQKRRLGLARLVLTKRRVWLLDEPTVSLDTASTLLFATVLRAHLAQGGLALVATHIELGLPEARVFDLAPFRADADTKGNHSLGFDEAFT